MATITQKNTLAALILAAGLGPVAAQDAALETQIVDAMNKAYGVHPGFRANHAKGVVAEGTFIATPEAARLSKAVIFNGSPIPVTVRFSDSTGIPNLPDGSALANPHGMAIKFHIPDGGETDMVINSLKFFPVSSGADFRDMLLAVAESPPGAPKPTKLEQFAASHPNMPRALATVQTPASIPWPKSNEVVELGVLTIDKPVPDSLEAQKKLLFLPGQLIEGIEPSDDPLIGVRDGAYAVSFSRRNP
jgi:catalase